MAAERAREAYREATAGSKDFLAVAKLYSDDPDLERNGGSLGYKPPGSFTLTAWTQLEKMKAGEVAEPLETAKGFQIFLLVARKPRKMGPFYEVQQTSIATQALKILN